MREYELTVVYDLAVQEAGGPDASVQQLTTLVEARGGKLTKVDHWGRRRMAYPINRAIDGDYIVSRVEMEPDAVAPLEASLRIDERVYRHLVVRADELPAPMPPREPRQQPGAAAAPAGEGPVEPAAPEAAAPAEAEAATAPAEGEAAAEEPAPVAEAPAAEEVVAEEPAAASEAVSAEVDSPAEAASGEEPPAESE
jgi:small subunit ribosomal protein S6